MFQDLSRWQEKLTVGAHHGIAFYEQHKDMLPSNPTQVVFAGMGGSGIAGKLLKTLLDKQTSVVTTVLEGTYVPGYIDENALAFVVSYSGNTWETIEVLKLLLARRVQVVVLAHGGRAMQLAQERNLLFMQVPEALTPRSALGYFLGMLCPLLQAFGLLAGSKIIDQFVHHVEQHNALLASPGYYASFLALVGKRDFFHIWGVSGDSEAVAYRAQTQFNENSKIQVVKSNFPELCHNLIVGMTNPSIQPFVLLMYTDYLAGNLAKSVDAMQELLVRRGVALYKVPVLGDTFECQLFHMVLWADFASYYLGKMYGVELEPVVLIDELKKEHRQKGITV